ncbi:E2/UBC family protein [Rhodophyticola sp. CCM32]|uniref:E2/UBC family protein n=1 Tax=Rhodophyticola sp. CCM32 TaxID=2916397 RepID=UPI00143DF1CA|nr:E2/UBC family protein [Rhodophyticola sp. CCM32]
MPEEQLSDVRRVERKRIVLEVENAIKTRVGGKVTRLEHSVLKSAYPRRPYTEGWRVPVVFTDGQIRDVDVLVSAAFPNVPPRAALVDRPAYLTWPHIEHDGILCLLNNLSEVDPDDPVSVAINILGRAVQLVEELIDGAIVDRDFKEEFLTYWFYGASDAAKDVVTLFEPVSPSRGVFQYKHDGITYVGDDVDQLATWISNRFGQKEAARCRHRAARAAFIWLKEPPCRPSTPKLGRMSWP